MKPEWLLYAEHHVRREIDKMPARKSGKNVERHLLSTWRQAYDEKKYPGSLGRLENIDASPSAAIVAAPRLLPSEG